MKNTYRRPATPTLRLNHRRHHGRLLTAISGNLRWPTTGPRRRSEPQPGGRSPFKMRPNIGLPVAGDISGEPKRAIVRPALARKVESRSRFARSSRSISTACDRVLIAMAVRGPVPSDTDAVLGPGVGLSGVGIGLVPWVTASASPRPSNSAVSGTSVRVAPGPDL